MKQVSNNIYIAKEGYTFIRKSDGFNMGDSIQLGYVDGVKDSINNYREVSVAYLNKKLRSTINIDNLAAQNEANI